MHHQPGPSGLYDPRFEHDACGVSFVADLNVFFTRYHRDTYGWEGAPVHDAVALATVIRPDLVETRLRNVEVELESEHAVEVVALLPPLVYFVFIWLKGTLEWYDSVVLTIVYLAYLYILNKIPPQGEEKLEDMERIPRAILMQRPAMRNSIIISLFITGALVLYFVAHPFLESMLGRRMNPRPLMTASSVVLSALAISLVGQGVRALQEGAVVGLTPLALPKLPALGLYSTVQGLGAQLIVLLLVVVPTLLERRATPATRRPADSSAG